MMPSERGTPPEIVHNTPVPAQVMHSNTLRRFTPRSPSFFLDSLIVVLRYPTDARETGRDRGLFPDDSWDCKMRLRHLVGNRPAHGRVLTLSAAVPSIEFGPMRVIG